MKFPLVKTTTQTGVTLSGFLYGENREGIFLHIHGTGGNFYYNNELLEHISETLSGFKYSLLSTNNSGSEIYNVWRDSKTSGASNEIFEDSLIDIDAWIEFALKDGFKKIILSGHSLGTEKVVYYMSKGKHKDKISGVLLLGFSDSFGNQEKYLKNKKQDYMNEAIEMVKNGNGDKLIQSDLLVHSGFLPKTANSYINFFSPNSELSTAFPFRKGNNLKRYSEITVPILAIIGDQEEFTIIPISEAVELLKSENKNAQAYQIKNCDHEFTDHEREVCKYLKEFMSKLFN